MKIIELNDKTRESSPKQATARESVALQYGRMTTGEVIAYDISLQHMASREVERS